jgi:hypothetical protein
MQQEISLRQRWSAVGSMALCVELLIAAEFMPVSLLTPIAAANWELSGRDHWLELSHREAAPRGEPALAER